MSLPNQTSPSLGGDTERALAPGDARLSAFELRAAAFLSITFAVLGILLRVQRYVLGRSFRNDEGSLAGAIMAHDWLSTLTKPFDGRLTAPVGFVVAEKAMVTLLGNQDFIFRLVPLASGLASVLLVYLLARKLLGPAGSVFCVGAFAVSWMSVFYASDLKQYSSDILFALLILLAASRSFERGRRRDDLLLAATGLVAVSLSHPAIFTLAVVGPVLLYHRWSRREGRTRLAVIGALWLLAFLLLYMVFYRSVGEVGSVVGYWEDLNGLMPIPPWQDPGWFLGRPAALLVVVGGLSGFVLIPAAFYVLGLLGFIRRGQWQWTAWLFGPVVMTLIASGVANYPFKGRLILFLVPGAFLAIGEGAQELGRLIKPQVAARSAAWVAAIFLLWSPTSGMLSQLQQPRSAPYPEDIKPVLQYVHDNLQAGDIIVVYHDALPTYTYYAPLYGLSANKTYSLADWRKRPVQYKNFIDVLPKNRRIWFIFSRVQLNKDHQDERQYILDHVRSAGGDVIQQLGVSGDISSAHLVVLR